MTALTPPPSPPPPSGSLPEYTKRLQDEKNALRFKVEELTRCLAQEQAARSTLEHEAQLRELELRNIQQHSAQAYQQALDKQTDLEKELKDEVAVHKMAIMGRNAATQKNTTLAAELKVMETKWKKELQKKETAIANAELAAEEIQILKVGRDQLMRRTESDAKRVRKLWQQIAREHDAEVEVLKQELLQAQQLSTSVECQQKIAKLDKELQKTCEEKTALEEQLSAARNERHRTAMELQKLNRECKLYAQQEEAAVKERDVAVHNSKEALDDKSGELLALKTEFADLVDKHEVLTAQLKQSARKREAQLILRTRKLCDSKRYAEELAVLRKKEILGYKRVLDSVNTRLTEAQELSESAWSLSQNGRKAKTSFCVYRH